MEDSQTITDFLLFLVSILTFPFLLVAVWAWDCVTTSLVAENCSLSSGSLIIGIKTWRNKFHFQSPTCLELYSQLETWCCLLDFELYQTWNVLDHWDVYLISRKLCVSLFEEYYLLFQEMVQIITGWGRYKIG